MPDELRGVDQDAGPGPVRERGEPADRQHLAGDVRYRGHDQERCRRRGELGLQRDQGVLDGLAGRDEPRPVAPLPWCAPPQQVGALPDVEDDDVARSDARREVEGNGGIAGEDDGVVDPRTDELPHRFPGGVEADVDCGRQATGGCGQDSGHGRKLLRQFALAASGRYAAGSSPGAPHREGGLPTSEPGLVTGTHDLRPRVVDLARTCQFSLNVIGS